MLNRIFFISLFFTLINATSVAVAQTDSTDLSFTSSAVVFESEFDSLLYLGGDFLEYKLDFDITDLSSFGKLIIELKEVSSGELMFLDEFTLVDLQDEEAITGSSVSLNFGKLSSLQEYTVTIEIENLAGELGASISKTH